MDTQDPPNRPRYQLTRGLIGLDNEKDAMTSRCLDRKEVRHATLRAHTGTGTLVGALCTHIRRLFLSFGGPVCADRISNCPLDRVLTYKNLIYLLNLQVCHQVQQESSPVRVPSPGQGSLGSGRSEHMGGHGQVCLSRTPLITNVINKILGHDCLWIIVIAPGWPNMSWFGDLVNLSTQIPL